MLTALCALSPVHTRKCASCSRKQRRSLCCKALRQKARCATIKKCASCVRTLLEKVRTLLGKVRILLGEPGPTRPRSRLVDVVHDPIGKLGAARTGLRP